MRTFQLAIKVAVVEFKIGRAWDFLISHNVQPTLSISEKVKDVHLPLHTAPVIARSAATRQSSAFDFVAAFLDCRATLAMTAHLFAQLNLVANQVGF